MSQNRKNLWIMFFTLVVMMLGFGIIKGTQTINFRTLRKIAYGWVATPVVAGVFGAVAFLVSNLHYLPRH